MLATFAQQMSSTEPCNLDTYRQALDAVFTTSAPDRLLTLEVLPSRAVETAIAFDGSDGNIRMLLLKPDKQLWSELHIFEKRQTVADCMAKAHSMHTSRADLSVSPDQAQQLLDEYRAIDLRLLRCAAPTNRGCPTLLDGRSFVIKAPDGPGIRSQTRAD